MKNLILAPLLALAASSCVATQADFDRLKLSVEDHRRATLETLEEYEDEKIDKDEARAQLAAADANLKGEIEEVRKAIVERVEEVTAQVASTQGMTGNPLLDLVIGGIGAVGASVVTTNHVRDKRREKRHEPV